MKRDTIIKFSEWLVLFIISPIIIFMELIPIPKLALLTIPFFYTVVIFVFSKPTPLQPSLQGNHIKMIALRSATSVLLLILFTYILYPQKLFIILRTKPQLLGFVILFYPFFSALPQEFIYRRFYFDRYKSVFTNKKLLIATNIFTFSFLHIIYDNWIAIGLTFIGGIYFVYTYLKTRSFLLTWIEHSLYGQVIFSVGLGSFFYERV